MKCSPRVQHEISSLPPSTFRGGWRAVLLLPIALMLASFGYADEPVPEQHDNPYSSGTGAEQHGNPYRHGPGGGLRHPPGPQGARARTWTGLKVQSGSTLSLVFGSDPYHDGATLAAILHGLESGEHLMIERTDSGVLLRRHGGSTGSAYDQIYYESDQERQRP